MRSYYRLGLSNGDYPQGTFTNVVATYLLPIADFGTYEILPTH